ncbi:hypothetical protein [Saccharopolyspora sp. 5N708]|uniref:hypothetical protein n=1 Tax=Saccharopolyspora sp. 5N708 TaxID=3457424 RepID=UPI003FCFF9AC
MSENATTVPETPADAPAAVETDAGQEPEGTQNVGTPADGDELASLDSAALAKMVRKLRAENASARTNAKQRDE